MFVKKTLVALMLAATLAGCASDGLRGQKATLGTLAGAVGGAAVGSQFGGGRGRYVGMAAGALIGGFLGNQIGAALDEQDKQLYASAQYQALESGQPQRWNNPQTGRSGDIVTGSTYVVNNQQCREYTNTIYIDGQPQVARGTACRNPDGTWRPVG
jgi:surface antigen